MDEKLIRFLGALDDDETIFIQFRSGKLELTFTKGGRFKNKYRIVKIMTMAELGMVDDDNFILFLQEQLNLLRESCENERRES